MIGDGVTDLVAGMIPCSCRASKEEWKEGLRRKSGDGDDAGASGSLHLATLPSHAPHVPSCLGPSLWPSPTSHQPSLWATPRPLSRLTPQLGRSTLNREVKVFGIHVTAIWTPQKNPQVERKNDQVYCNWNWILCWHPWPLWALMFTWWTFSNQHVLIMQDFEGVGFGCCLGLRCSYF